MIEIHFTKKFGRTVNDVLQTNYPLFTEITEKITEFRDPKNHKRLKVHKLHGRMKSKYSFSVDYKNRIVFEYLNKKSVVLMDFGDHDVYQ